VTNNAVEKKKKKKREKKFGMLLIEDNIFLSPNKPIEKILYWGNPFCSPHYPNKSPFP